MAQTQAMEITTEVKAIGYLRVSTQLQEESGAGLIAQQTAILEECKRRNTEPTWIMDAAVSGAIAPDKRPALGPALSRLDRGEFGILIVSRLDRLGRSLRDVAALLDRAERNRWAVVSVDTSGLDMSSPTGRLVAGVLASAAAFERDLARQRTREGLAARRAQGVRLGRPPALSDETVERIRECRANGLSLRQIAAQLDQAHVPTAHGGRRWHAQTVASVIASRGHADSASL
jgi:DNA invertase Pin-like site-specific DNA recombinase